MSKPLVIGVDIRDLKLAKTGTKTYLEEFCKAFREISNDQLSFKFLDTSLPVYKGSSKLGKYVEHFNYQFWKQVTLPLKAYFNGCNVLFCTDNFVPLMRLGFETVPVFHDAFFFENPEHYGKLWLKLYHLTAIPAAKRSAFIVTPSTYAQQQIHHYTGIPLSQLKVVYEGPKTMKVHEETDILGRFGIERKNYVLHVGSMFKRKNIPALIHAFKELKSTTDSPVKLVLAGPSNASKDSNDQQAILDAISETGLENEIILTGYLSDNELATIYSGALMYVFPSTNEGFGIPILEAFDYQLPVLVADNTSLPEVGGDAVLTFDPFNISNMCSKMKMLLDDEILRNEMIRKGNERLKEFSWVKSSLQLVALFRQIGL
ncbi:glycosyltransferase family 1 protein [Pedobacter sp. MC2016-15]|uniref:glycosyltransferase family 4 protein n=1 Tax=Pedobacter sp. MC2016-15 TaxID=2994473 RepID=UPI00224755C1|nr:glycosyltransferase family 1 protein [Pedobacter sp. MC2016-15]MCX2481155.1 glycosyltransferase family 1 protein [Pedobacter sp. MC2016-15]